MLSSGQHKELLYGVLDVFGVTPDYDLRVMSEGQSLASLTSRILLGTSNVIERSGADILIVHGDTTTALAATLAGFYAGVCVAHVEAGLRTNNILSPFPEEYNRRAIALTASYHFAPTEAARQSLLGEGVNDGRIFVTGNTVVDALQKTVKEDFRHPLLDWADGRRIVFLTAHRRENASALEGMLLAVRELAKREDVCFIYPVHPSPAVRKTAYRVLGNTDRVRLCEPFGVVECHNILARSYLVLTDSGGLQEEAAALRVPVFVMRDTTERQEGIEAGAARLAGTQREGIIRAVCALLDSKNEHAQMCAAKNPYGDGDACRRIADVLLAY